MKKVLYSRLPSKSFRKNLFSLIGKRSIITFHSFGDLDSCASSIALSELLGKSSIIAMQDTVQSDVKNLIKDYYPKFMKFSKAIELYPNAPIIVVDCNEKNLLLNNVEEADFLIDHHALSQNSIKAKNYFVWPEASSTSELVAKLFMPSEKVASLLILAIVADSAKLINSSSDTFYVLHKLLKKYDLDFQEVCQPLYVPYPFKKRLEILKSLSSINFYHENGYIVASGSSKIYSGLIAESLIKIGADVAFIASTNKFCIISARMHKRNLFSVDLVKIVKEVGVLLGGDGGGHSLAACASGPKIENCTAALELAKNLFFEQIKS
ncbi:MAG: DHH family phosphoesterase [Candidatus Anstonellaceae archaeon]